MSTEEIIELIDGPADERYLASLSAKELFDNLKERRRRLIRAETEFCWRVRLHQRTGTLLLGLAGEYLNLIMERMWARSYRSHREYWGWFSRDLPLTVSDHERGIVHAIQVISKKKERKNWCTFAGLPRPQQSLRFATPLQRPWARKRKLLRQKLLRATRQEAAGGA